MIEKEIRIEIDGVLYILETTGGESSYIVERLFNAETRELYSYRASTTDRVSLGENPSVWEKIDLLKKEKEHVQV